MRLWLTQLVFGPYSYRVYSLSRYLLRQHTIPIHIYSSNCTHSLSIHCDNNFGNLSDSNHVYGHLKTVIMQMGVYRCGNQSCLPVVQESDPSGSLRRRETAHWRDNAQSAVLMPAVQHRWQFQRTGGYRRDDHAVPRRGDRAAASAARCLA